MTNTTPHPTDALPLPEPFAALSDDETPALYKRWADQIRAARREGFELAMQTLATPIHDPAVTTPREVMVGESPVDRIAAPAQEQPAFKIYKGEVCYKSAENDQSFGMWCPVSTDYHPTFPEGTNFYAAPQEQSGAPVLPLSAERIDKIREALVEKMMATGMLAGDDAWDHSLARAIERAHNITEPGAGVESAQ